MEDKNKTRKKLKKKIKKESSNFVWIVKITIIAMIISFIFSFASETILPNVSLIISIFALILFIFVGILFDMVGVAVTAASEQPFHSMSSRKVKGSKVAIKFKNNANKVSTFCCDVIGDICGVISGSTGIIVSNSIATNLNVNLFFTTLLVTSIIAALTIGGKAIGKGLAINKGNIILFKFAKIVSIFYNPKR